MGWKSIESALNGRWAFNSDGIFLLMRAAVRARLIRNRSHVVATDHGFLMPTTYVLETDWSGFRAELERETQRYWIEATRQIRLNPSLMRGTLLGLVDDARRDMAWMEDQRISANRRSTGSIDAVVNGWENALTVARVVRDASATILVVTAGIVSGGTGLAAASAAGMTGVSSGTAMTTLAVGSVMRGSFTYQDTGNVGSALVNTAGTFTVGAIGLGAAGATMSTAETATILLISSAGQGATTGVQALVEGRNGQDAAAAAATSAMFGFAGGVIGSQLGNMSLIGQVSISGVADMTGNAASSAVIADATNPMPRPLLRGGADYGGLPTNARNDEMYVAQTCLFALR